MEQTWLTLAFFTLSHLAGKDKDGRSIPQLSTGISLWVIGIPQVTEHPPFWRLFRQSCATSGLSANILKYVGSMFLPLNLSDLSAHGAFRWVYEDGCRCF